GEIENIGKSSTYRDANTHTMAQSWLPLGLCYFVNVNGTSVEVEFMEVIGNAIYEDLTRLSKDLEK
ncbi:14341_t:CDS:1, partial [Gigaspora margarita]